MSVFDLRQWLADAERAGELQHILGADAVLDIGAASQLDYRRKYPHALLFDEIAGHAVGQRVLTSSLSSPALMGMSLGLGAGLDDQGLVEALRGWTRCAVVTSDPDTGVVNVGAYRIQVQDDGAAASINMEPGKHGAQHVRAWFAKEGRAPVAVSLGHREWAGYYSGGVTPVLTVEITGLFYRSDPVSLGAPPGKPPHDYSYMRSVMKSAMAADALISSGLPGVTGVWCHEAGGGRSIIAVALEQRYAGHSRQAGVPGRSAPGDRVHEPAGHYRRPRRQRS